jgi:RHS repeat-associated protein
MNTIPAPVILKRDVLGRVTVTPARREELLDAFERSGLKGQPFANLVGVNYQPFVFLGSATSELGGYFVAVCLALPSLWLPAEQEKPLFDGEGNLISDARWTYQWDAHNQLVEMQASTSAQSQGLPVQRLQFTYDSQSRRMRKLVETFVANEWILTQDRRFLYNGRNLIAEFEMKPNATALTLHASYAWGLDLSGSAQGAGGVGGLLFAYEHREGTDNIIDTDSNVTGIKAPSHSSAPCYDGNGNITAYIDLTSAQVTARYEYDAFGRTILKDESPTQPQAFGFSTKYQDQETGLLYYGYRFYSPDLGRWINRDPIGERGGINLYGMVRNNAISRWDKLGNLDFGDPTWTLSDPSNEGQYPEIRVNVSGDVCSCGKGGAITITVYSTDGPTIGDSDVKKSTFQVDGKDQGPFHRGPADPGLGGAETVQGDYYLAVEQCAVGAKVGKATITLKWSGGAVNEYPSNRPLSMKIKWSYECERNDGKCKTKKALKAERED